jgi:hypothetical protein
MAESPWRNEILAKAMQWPLRFRARLEEGIWNLVGANEAADWKNELAKTEYHQPIHPPRFDPPEFDWRPRPTDAGAAEEQRREDKRRTTVPLVFGSLEMKRSTSKPSRLSPAVGHLQHIP